MRIEKLEPSRHVKGRWLVFLADDRLLRVTENEMVTFGLTVGSELSEADIARLLEEGDRNGARALAAALVGRRAMSRQELVQKLTARDVFPDTAEEAADWLETIGALNDEDYAASLVRHYSSRGYGQGRIRQELFRRGIPKELWPDAMEEAAPPEDGIDRFLSSRLRDPDDPKQCKRVTDALLRRGYRWEDIKAGLRRFGQDLED